MATEPIKFPILFRYHQHVVPAGLEMLPVWGLKHIEENRFLMPESVQGKVPVLRWLIDGDGRLREAVVIGMRNEWLRPLSWLWRFTQTIYEIKSGRVATVGELLSLNKGASRDPEKSSSKDFQNYLSCFSQDTPFTRSMFLEFMNESPDVDSPTYP